MRHLPRAPDGRIYIFSDIERLSPVERERAGMLRDTLSLAPGTRSILNDPRRSLCRYELLRLLHDRGQNAFNLYRVSERVEPKSFPVFIRREDDHRGPISELIDSSSALRQALDEMEDDGPPTLIRCDGGGYLDTNPHESELCEIFELADIEYGRIDYGLGDQHEPNHPGQAPSQGRTSADSPPIRVGLSFGARRSRALIPYSSGKPRPRTGGRDPLQS